MDVISHLFHPTGLASWRYQQVAKGRDERIDFLRGMAILTVIINHVAVRSLYLIFSVEAIGAISAAEGFILLSGIIIGLVYHKRIQQDGLRQSQSKLIQRAFQIYLVALITNLIVYFLQWFPKIDLSVLTSYTDVTTGIVYSLYGSNPSVITFIGNILLLTYGPGQINILGLYIALLAVTPTILWLLQKNQPFVVVGMSWLLYAFNAVHPTRALPFQSENAFPVLAWQILFVHGVLAGYYRHKVRSILAGWTGCIILILAFILFLACCFFAINNPWYDIPVLPRLALIPETTYYWIYSNFFGRTPLEIGRVINTFAVIGILYLVLTFCWIPCQRIAGWLCVPLGQATLYIFIIHILFVLMVHNINILQHENIILNTVAHTVVIGIIWIMVRRKTLFQWIPR
jgi:hypothetical protein